MENSNISVDSGAPAREGKLRMSHLASNGDYQDRGSEVVVTATPSSSTKDRTEAYYSTWVRRRF